MQKKNLTLLIENILFFCHLCFNPKRVNINFNKCPINQTHAYQLQIWVKVKFGYPIIIIRPEHNATTHYGDILFDKF